MRSGLYILLVPLLVAACALGAAMMLAENLVSRERKQLLTRTDSEAKHVASQLSSAIIQAMDVLPSIGNWWLSQGRPEARQDWETDAQLFLRKGTGLRELVWIDTFDNTQWSVRPGEAPKFKSRPTDPELLDTLHQARLRNALTLSRAITRDGVPQFYACVPIHSGKLSGFVAGLFDARALANSLLGGQVPPDYEVTVTLDGVPLATLKSARSPLWREGLRTAEAQSGDRRWSARLVPAATDIQTLQWAIWSFGVIVATLLYALTALTLQYKRNESALARANQALGDEMSERHHAEKVIQQQVADFQTLVEVLPVGLAVSNDPECREIWVNPQLAAMLHVTRDENISISAPHPGRLPYKHMRNGLEVPVNDLPMQVAATTGKAVLDVALDIVRSDGSVLHTLSYSAPVIEPDGSLRRVINVCVDVTDRKSLEERLVRAEKTRSLVLMAGGVAHDFNNLLTTILGYAEIARGQVPANSPAGQSIAQILPAVHRAAALAGQLLSYTGRGWLELQPVDLSTLIYRLAEPLRATAPDAVDVQFDLAGDLPPVHAGAREVQHVLNNLVTNAVEAIGDVKGVVKVRTDVCHIKATDLARDYPDQELVAGTFVLLEVSDSGGGVPKELRARVFDPFFTTKFMGRGLGLSEVHGIMRAHRGGVRLDTSPSGGACVQAIFPVETTTKARGAVADRCA